MAWFIKLLYATILDGKKPNTLHFFMMNVQAMSSTFKSSKMYFFDVQGRSLGGYRGA